MFRTVSARIEYSATVVIAQLRGITGPAQYAQRIQHFLEGSIELRRDGNMIQRSQNTGMQEEIESVDVIVSRLLKVQAIRPNLLLGCLQNDLPSALSPSFRLRQFRAQCADEEQRYCLTEQVSIRREIGRKMALRYGEHLRRARTPIRFGGPAAGPEILRADNKPITTRDCEKPLPNCWPN